MNALSYQIRRELVAQAHYMGVSVQDVMVEISDGVLSAQIKDAYGNETEEQTSVASLVLGASDRRFDFVRHLAELAALKLWSECHPSVM